MHEVCRKNIARIEYELNCLSVKFSIVAVSETWLTPLNAELHCLSGYSPINLYRDKRRGGGVSLFVKESLHYITRKDLNVFNADIEAVFIEIDKKLISTKKNIVVGCVYRPPDHSVATFQTLLVILLNLSKVNIKIAICLGIII